MKELYKKYRPRTLKAVVGNTATVNTLKNMLERGSVPHTILFHGPSGCGKTTLARILKTELKCSDLDFQELNCSDFRGIDTVREIRNTMMLSAVGGPCRIWLMDELHMMTSAGQNAMLKMLEDTPAHVWFILCTTDPQKLLKTIRTRCCEITVEELSENNAKKLLRRVSKREKIKLSQNHAEEIVDVSEGSARKCLVLLDKIRNLPESERSEAITAQDEEREGIELCRALIQRKPWSTITKFLREYKGEPEKLRWAVMGYCGAILMKKADEHVHHVLTCFEDNFYNSKKFGLISACFEALNGDSDGDF